MWARSFSTQVCRVRPRPSVTWLILVPRILKAGHAALLPGFPPVPPSHPEFQPAAHFSNNVPPCIVHHRSFEIQGCVPRLSCGRVIHKPVCPHPGYGRRFDEWSIHLPPAAGWHPVWQDTQCENHGQQPPAGAINFVRYSINSFMTSPLPSLAMP